MAIVEFNSTIEKKEGLKMILAVYLFCSALTAGYIGTMFIIFRQR
jgi:hypothetical protein